MSTISDAIRNAGTRIGDIIRGTPNYGQVGMIESPNAYKNVPITPAGGQGAIIPGNQPGRTQTITVYPGKTTSAQRAGGGRGSTTADYGVQPATTTMPITSQAQASAKTISSQVKPTGTISAAPTTWEIFKGDIKQAGIFGGTLDFLSGRAAKVVDITEQTQMKQGIFSGQSLMEPSEKLTRIAPYFTPAAPVIMLGEGFESYLYPKGQANILGTKQALKDIGVPNFISTGAAYSLPAAESFAGMLGIKTQAAGISRASEISQLSTGNIKVTGIRLQEGNIAKDFLIASQKTSKASYLTKIEVPVFQTEKGFTFEGGRGTTFRLQKNLFSENLRAVTFETGGMAVNTGIPKISKAGITQVLPDMSSVIGKGFIQPEAAAEFKVTRGIAGDKYLISAKGKMQPIAMEKTKFNFFGIGKQEENILTSMGGKISKVNYDIVNNQISFAGKPTTFGKIKVITRSDLKVSESFGGGSFGLSTKQLPKFSGGYAESLAKTSMISSVPSVKAPTISRLAPVTFGFSGIQAFELPAQKVIQRQIPVYAQSTAETMIEMPKTKLAYIPLNLNFQIPGQKAGQGTGQFPVQFPMISQIPREITGQQSRFRTPNVPIIPVTPAFPIIPGGFFIPPFKFPEFGWTEKLGKGFNLNRQFKYTPNIGSVLAGFKMPKITGKIKFAELTGFLPRPMIFSSRKRRRKK